MGQNTEIWNLHFNFLMQSRAWTIYGSIHLLPAISFQSGEWTFDSFTQWVKFNNKIWVKSEMTSQMDVVVVKSNQKTD